MDNNKVILCPSCDAPMYQKDIGLGVFWDCTECSQSMEDGGHECDACHGYNTYVMDDGELWGYCADCRDVHPMCLECRMTVGSCCYCKLD